MSRSTAATAGGRCPAVAAVLAAGLLWAAPALAHDEGLTPYRYVVAPPGVTSQGPAQSGSSTQPLGQFGFAGTTDNQMQLTLPEGALLPETDQTGVRVQLDQLAPGSLPALPAGLEPEGNGYRVRLSYTPSGAPLTRLNTPATLGLSAPAPPTAMYELIDGTWQKVDFVPVTADAGFTSVIMLDGPGTFLQAYDPTSAPAATSPAPPAARPAVTARTEPGGLASGWLVAGGGALLLAAGLAALHRRGRSVPRSWRSR